MSAYAGSDGNRSALMGEPAYVSAPTLRWNDSATNRKLKSACPASSATSRRHSGSAFMVSRAKSALIATASFQAASAPSSVASTLDALENLPRHI